MKRQIGAILLLLFTTAAFAFLKSVDIEPLKASWSGKASGDPQYGGIAQTIMANFDSVSSCELFIGDLGGSPSHEFNAYITDEDGTPVARGEHVVAQQGHAWLRFPLTTETGQKFTRAKQYLVKFTRPGDSIQYYYNEVSKYDHGRIVLPGDQPPPTPEADLCMRLFGRARADGMFSVMSVIAMRAADAGESTPGDRENWEYCVGNMGTLPALRVSGLYTVRIGEGHLSNPRLGIVVL